MLKFYNLIESEKQK